MLFSQTLIPGILLRRYKRFLADVRLESGETVTAHCANSGSMKRCADPGWKVLLSESDNPKRKLKYTWELVHNGTCWIGINTQIPNKIAAEAIRKNLIHGLTGYPVLETEKKYGKNSRIDILLRDGEKCCYVEVKSVTLIGEDGAYIFPDAVTERGKKHLLELINVVNNGHRAAMLYIIQRSDGNGFRPAEEMDSAYAETWLKAKQAGVEMYAFRAQITPEEITVETPVKILW